MPRRRLRTLACVMVLWALLVGAARPARGDAAWDEARKAFRAAQAATDWKERREAYVRLADFDSAEAVAEVLAALEDETFPPVLVAGLDALAAQRSQAARAALLEAARKGRGQEGLYVIAALARHKGPEVEAALQQAAQGPNAPMAAQAALSLGTQAAGQAVPTLLPLLRHKDWQVRRSAARALERLKAKEALGPLAAALALEKGRVRADLIAALAAISGQDLGNDPAAWALLAGGATGAIPRQPAPPPSLFGVPLYGQRVVVCLDASLRTGDPHPFTPHVRLREVCTPPEGAPIPVARMLTILDFERGHAKHWLDGLEGASRFELVLYNEKVRHVLGKLSSPGSAAKKLVLEALDALRPDNGIAAYPALVEALDVAGGGDAGAWKNGPDEIVFVGASTPNTGEVTEADVIAPAIALKAGLRQVPIHMVGIHTHPYDMHRLIAERTGGRYVDLTK